MGYRFIAPVRTVELDTPEAAIASTQPSVSDVAETSSIAAPKRNGKRHLWLALTISAAVFVAIFALKIYPGVWANRRPVIQSVAVLPLVNLSDDPEQEYFSDGITEELTTNLSYARPLRVLSRSSTIGFKGSHLSAPQIA
jgi:hypothetical protein